MERGKKPGWRRLLLPLAVLALSLPLFALGCGAENTVDRERQETDTSSQAESGADDRDRKTLIQILLYYEIFRRRRKSGKMPVVYPDKNDYNGYGG